MIAVFAIIILQPTHIQVPTASVPETVLKNELKRGHQEVVPESPEVAALPTSGVCSCWSVPAQHISHDVQGFELHRHILLLGNGTCETACDLFTNTGSKGRACGKNRAHRLSEFDCTYENTQNVGVFRKITARSWRELPDHRLQTNAGNVSKLLFIW